MIDAHHLLAEVAQRGWLDHMPFPQRQRRS
jgi:hypothetical protein